MQFVCGFGAVSTSSGVTSGLMLEVFLIYKRYFQRPQADKYGMRTGVVAKLMPISPFSKKFC